MLWLVVLVGWFVGCEVDYFGESDREVATTTAARGRPLYVNISRRRSFIRESRVRVSVSESSPYRLRSASFQSRLVTGSVVVVSRRSSGAHRELRANWISIANYFN